jgi:hypothetical protein
MGADGHSNNTRELQAIAEALCLDSQYAANAIQGFSQVQKNAETGKRLYFEEACHGRVDSPSPMFQATVKFQGTRERMSLRRAVRPA